MGFLILVLAGFSAWGFIFWQIDRPSVPAWKVRNIYRLVSLLLLLLLVMVSYKAVRYHDELVFQIRHHD